MTSCNCGGGHSVSADSPSGHAVSCPLRAKEVMRARLQQIAQIRCPDCRKAAMANLKDES